MRRARRLLIGLPLVLIGLYVAGWFVGAELAKQRIADRLGVLQDQGYRVDLDTLAVAGFPARFDITVAGYSVATPGGVTGEGRSIRAGGSVIDFLLDRSVAIEAAAEQTVTLAGVPPLTVRLAGAEGAVRLAGLTAPQPQGGHVVARDVVLSAPGETLTIDQASVAQSVPLERDGQTDPGFGGLTVVLQAIGLPEGMGRGQPDLIERIAADLAITRPWPVRPAVPDLAAWRDAGGVVEVLDFQLDWGAVQLAASGTLSLDADLQPTGRLDATVVGLDQLIQAVAGEGGQGDIGLTGISLGGLFGGGGDQGVTLPLTIAGGRIGLGPVPLARLPRIVWPER